MELLNPPQDPNVADSTVIDENKIGVELSDRQNYLLRRGVGSNRPESETLDKMSGKFITTENAEKWAKLRQRIAQVRLAATFGKGQSFYVSQGVIDSFKSRKPFRMNQKVPGRKKQYSFQTDGNTLFQLTPDVPQKRYEIASWDDEGNLNWSFENHDSSSTIQAGKMLGIDIERKGGQMFVNGEYMDHTTIGKPRKIPKGELQSGFVSKGKGRKPMTPEQYERSKRQTSYRHKSRAYWRKQEGVLGEQITDPETGEIYDQATIQPYQQRQINKALGFPEEHNVGTVTPATQFHHGIPAKTLEKMGIPRDSPGAIRGSTPLSHKTHMEVEHPEATTHPGNVMANRIRKKLKKARLKIARIRQRNISRINIAQKSVMNLRETRVSDIRRTWNEQAANRKKSPKGFTILDGDVLDLNYPAHTQKILDKYPGKGNVYIVSNLKDVTNIDSPEVDIGFDKWKKLNYTPQAGGFEGGVEMNALFRAEDNEQAKAFTSDFDQDSYTEVRPDGTFGFYDRDGNEKHYG